MKQPFTQRDIGFTIVSRLEEALRSFISEKLTNSYGVKFLEGIPDGIIRVVSEKTNETQWDDLQDFLEETNLPDLSEIICFTKNYSDIFKESIRDAKSFSSLISELYQTRCKIAHIRGYFNSTDLDILYLNSKKLTLYLDDIGKEIMSFLDVIANKPEKVIIPAPSDYVCDLSCTPNVPSNLPVPDYEYEGGFVGRNEDIKSVIKMIKGDRYPVVTLSGAGGVGKTALALKIAHLLLKDDSDIFDGIIWLSAKEEQLTYLGIEDIEPTVKNYEELIDTICSVMGVEPEGPSLCEKEENINLIIEVTQRLLIIIDNLETITDEKIINFILDANPKIKVLITSRKGLGQVERRYDVRQLKEKEAVTLFRQVSKDKSLRGLYSLDDPTIKDYVLKVSCYPLSIKWLIGQIALGKQIDDVINSIDSTTSDISKFCFDQIYGELSDKAKKIICALSLFDDPPSAGVLKYMIKLEKSDFEDGVRELILVSLIIPEQFQTESGEITSKFILLTLTRGYVRQQLDSNPDLKRTLSERMQKVSITIEESERAKRQYRFSLSHLGAITEEEKVAALIERTAYQKWATGRYSEALEEYKRAINIAPRFANLYRNWAFIESEEGHLVEADKLMEQAVKINPDDPSIWLVWGNMKRKFDKVKESLPLYERAYGLLPTDCYILNSLGQAKMRLGLHSEADTLYRKALEIDDSHHTKRHEIVNRSSIADNLRRWAETEIKRRNYRSAKVKLVEAIKNCEQAKKLDKRDNKTKDLLRKIKLNLGRFYLYNEINHSLAKKYFTEIIIKKPIRYVESKDTAIASYLLAKIFVEEKDYGNAQKVCSPKILKFDYARRNTGFKEKFQNLLDTISAGNTILLEGKIKSVNNNKDFSIIESIKNPNHTYFGHINDFPNEVGSLGKDLIGRNVIFSPIEKRTSKGIRKTAIEISFKKI